MWRVEQVRLTRGALRMYQVGQRFSVIVIAREVVSP